MSEIGRARWTAGRAGYECSVIARGALPLAVVLGLTAGCASSRADGFNAPGDQFRLRLAAPHLLIVTKAVAALDYLAARVTSTRTYERRSR
jgi:hypothetical protein